MGTLREDAMMSSSFSDPDYTSSSEQSCDTVIYVGANGRALSDRELTDNEGPPRSGAGTPFRRPSGSRSDGSRSSGDESGRRVPRAPKCGASVLSARMRARSGAASKADYPYSNTSHSPMWPLGSTGGTRSQEMWVDGPAAGGAAYRPQPEAQWVDGPGASGAACRTQPEAQWVDGPGVSGATCRTQPEAQWVDGPGVSGATCRTQPEAQWVDGPGVSGATCRTQPEAQWVNRPAAGGAVYRTEGQWVDGPGASYAGRQDGSYAARSDASYTGRPDPDMSECWIDGPATAATRANPVAPHAASELWVDGPNTAGASTLQETWVDGPREAGEGGAASHPAPQGDVERRTEQDQGARARHTGAELGETGPQADTAEVHTRPGRSGEQSEASSAGRATAKVHRLSDIDEEPQAAPAAEVARQPSTSGVSGVTHVRQPSTSGDVTHLRQPSTSGVSNVTHVRQPSTSSDVTHIRQPSTSGVSDVTHIRQPSTSSDVTHIRQPSTSGVSDVTHIRQPSASSDVTHIRQPSTSGVTDVSHALPHSTNQPSMLDDDSYENRLVLVEKTEANTTNLARPLTMDEDRSRQEAAMTQDVRTTDEETIFSKESAALTQLLTSLTESVADVTDVTDVTERTRPFERQPSGRDKTRQRPMVAEKPASTRESERVRSVRERANKTEQDRFSKRSVSEERPLAAIERLDRPAHVSEQPKRRASLTERASNVTSNRCPSTDVRKHIVTNRPSEAEVMNGYGDVSVSAGESDGEAGGGEAGRADRPATLPVRLSEACGGVERPLSAVESAGSLAVEPDSRPLSMQSCAEGEPPAPDQRPRPLDVPSDSFVRDWLEKHSTVEQGGGGGGTGGHRTPPAGPRKPTQPLGDRTAAWVRAVRMAAPSMTESLGSVSSMLTISDTTAEDVAAAMPSMGGGERPASPLLGRSPPPSYNACVRADCLQGAPQSIYELTVDERLEAANGSSMCRLTFTSEDDAASATDLSTLVYSAVADVPPLPTAASPIRPSCLRRPDGASNPNLSAVDPLRPPALERSVEGQCGEPTRPCAKPKPSVPPRTSSRSVVSESPINSPKSRLRHSSPLKSPSSIASSFDQWSSSPCRTPSKSTSAKSTPSKTPSCKSTPSKSTPSKTTPSKTTPTKTAPCRTKERNGSTKTRRSKSPSPVKRDRDVVRHPPDGKKKSRPSLLPSPYSVITPSPPPPPPRRSLNQSVSSGHGTGSDQSDNRPWSPKRDGRASASSGYDSMMRLSERDSCPSDESPPTPTRLNATKALRRKLSRESLAQFYRHPLSRVAAILFLYFLTVFKNTISRIFVWFCVLLYILGLRTCACVISVVLPANLFHSFVTTFVWYQILPVVPAKFNALGCISKMVIPLVKMI